MKKILGFFILSIVVFTQCKKETIVEEEPEITVLDLIPTCVLSAELPEISGLIKVDDKMIAHNDGGDENVIYSLSNSCEITNTYSIDGTINNDWEAITFDDAFIYIGDFGNNNGDRTNLAVLKVENQVNLSEEIPLIEKIEFSYDDQTDFNALFHNFDCEAMIPWGDSLYLFTKNRANTSSHVYSMAKTGNQQSIRQIATINDTRMVTDALYNEERDELWLLAYGISFISGNQVFSNQFIIIEKFSEDAFQGNILIKSIVETDQFESMTLMDKDHILLAHESENGGDATLYTVKIP